ncbi:MAG TPA: STAS domain-containing protein [bacterium]|nr:STAS domain-containing protein [bacterium]HOL47097.1 STAS domain-containing protein [bacterium]HPQ18851.1 STAS domain-containing protein [bacterium]
MIFSITITLSEDKKLKAFLINEKIDHYNAIALENALIKFAEFYDIILDFKNVKIFTSAAIGVLVNIYKISSKFSHSISIVNLSDNLKEIFNYSKLNKFFNY